MIEGIGHVDSLGFVQGDGNRSIKLVDAAGRTRVVLTLTLDGSPWMSFYDAAGTGRLVMGEGSLGLGRFRHLPGPASAHPQTMNESPMRAS